VGTRRLMTFAEGASPMDQSYAVFLLLGVVLVAIDGQLIYFSGRGYLTKAYGSNAESARSMSGEPASGL
jgi:ABC-type uncharacterized transport system permease subunit